jgi:hypothetical protein
MGERCKSFLLASKTIHRAALAVGKNIAVLKLNLLKVKIGYNCRQLCLIIAW